MGEEDFDPAVLSSLHECLGEHNLTEFADAAWDGFVRYGTNTSNPWGKSGNGTGPGHQYVEFDPRAMDNGVVVFETCNCASNLAYYRTMLSICERARKPPGSAGAFTMPSADAAALVKAFSSLAWGSSFFHAQGSLNGFGMNLDNTPIGLLSYVAHQASVAAVAASSPVVRDIAPVWRNATGVLSAAAFVDVVVHDDLYAWDGEITRRIGAEIPSYFVTFGTLVTTILNLLLPARAADPLVKLIAPLVMGSADTDFLLNEYAPEFRNLTTAAGISLTFLEKFRLGLKGTGTLLKLGYAFVWQEEMIQWRGIDDPELNRLGGEAMPWVNMVANALTGYAHDPAVQEARGVYPGDAACREGTSPHAKWHEQAGNGLLDLMFLADDVNALLSAHKAAVADTRGWIEFWTGFTPSWAWAASE